MIFAMYMKTSCAIDIFDNSRKSCKKLVLYLFACLPTNRDCHKKGTSKKALAIDIQPDCGKEL